MSVAILGSDVEGILGGLLWGEKALAWKGSILFCVTMGRASAFGGIYKRCCFCSVRGNFLRVTGA